jgi:hypothetical protein
MFIKKLTLKSVLFNLLLVMPIFSYAAISEQDKVNFKNIYSSEIKPETYANVLNFCDKNDTDIDSCLGKLKARPSEDKSIQKQTSYKFCCLNVSGFYGEYAYIHGQDYCIPPC